MDDRPPTLDRRQTLGLLGAPLLPAAAALPALVAPDVARAAAARGVRTDQITVLYRPATHDAPSRLDPAVQTAIRELERAFLEQGLKVLQPSAEVLRMMDQGQAVVITFAPDAGFSLVISAYRHLRQVPQDDRAIAEIRLDSRVIVGRHILAVESGRGQMFTRTDPASREFGERRALELAAGRAARELADRTGDRLRGLTAPQIEQMLGQDAPQRTDAEQIYPSAAGSAPLPPVVMPPPPPPAPPPPPPAAPPPAAPAPAPVAPAPAPTPAMPGPAPVAPAPQPPTPAPGPAPGAPAAPVSSGGKRWGLVVGMSNYGTLSSNLGSKINDLPGVARDVQNVARALAGMGFASERLAVLRDDQATSGAIRGLMKQLAAKVQPEDLVVLFISAHGGPKDMSASGFGMPILADFRPNDPNALDFWELQSMTRNLKGRVVWISDTCHSGGATTNIATVVVDGNGVSATQDNRGPDAMSVARASAAGQDFAILTASSPHEISWDTSEGGLFTSRLLTAIQRSGGQVPLGKLFQDQVMPAVIQESRTICQRRGACDKHPQQTPMMAFGGSGGRLVF